MIFTTPAAAGRWRSAWAGERRDGRRSRFASGRRENLTSRSQSSRFVSVAAVVVVVVSSLRPSSALRPSSRSKAHHVVRAPHASSSSLSSSLHASASACVARSGGVDGGVDSGARKLESRRQTSSSPRAVGVVASASSPSLVVRRRRLNVLGGRNGLGTPRGEVGSRRRRRQEENKSWSRSLKKSTRRQRRGRREVVVVALLVPSQRDGLCSDGRANGVVFTTPSMTFDARGVRGEDPPSVAAVDPNVVSGRAGGAPSGFRSSRGLPNAPRFAGVEQFGASVGSGGRARARAAASRLAQAPMAYCRRGGGRAGREGGVRRRGENSRLEHLARAASARLECHASCVFLLVGNTRRSASTAARRDDVDRVRAEPRAPRSRASSARVPRVVVAHSRVLERLRRLREGR